MFKKYSKNFQKYSKNFKKFKKIVKNFKNFFGIFLKFFLRNLLKMHYFSIVLSQFNEKGVNFCGFGRKTQYAENF